MWSYFCLTWPTLLLCEDLTSSLFIGECVWHAKWDAGKDEKNACVWVRHDLKWCDIQIYTIQQVIRRLWRHQPVTDAVVSSSLSPETAVVSLEPADC